MKLTYLSTALVLCGMTSTGIFAAGMDRSGQSIAAFLQPNNYFEGGISVLDANVSGQMRDGWNMPSADAIKAGNDLANTHISDMASSFNFANFALKYQVNDRISLGLIYDQPFGAKAEYSANDKKHTTRPDGIMFSFPITEAEIDKIYSTGAFHNGNEATKVDVTTQNLSILMGYQPTQNWNLYAGPMYQTVKGDVRLRGSVYGPYGGMLCGSSMLGTICSGFEDDKGNPSRGYDASISEKGAFGYLTGVAYQIPEIALKASLTYRSKVKYNIDIKENMPKASYSLVASPLPLGVPQLHRDYVYTEGKTKITTPQSLNVDFQTGIMANTLAFVNLRWVDWSDFKIRPHKFGELASGLTSKVAGTPRGFDLIAYEKDQISATFGVARKFNDQWAVSLLGGWDSGTGELASTLGPIEGYWSAGLGAQFSPTAATFIQAGARYFWMGDAKAQSASWFGTERYDADFENNDAIGYSLKIGYRF